MPKNLSRRKRLDTIIESLKNDVAERAEHAKTEVDKLQEELQSWLDGMPENLQESQKATDLQETVDGLESLHDTIDEITYALDSAEEESNTIEFPGMY